MHVAARPTFPARRSAHPTDRSADGRRPALRADCAGSSEVLQKLEQVSAERDATDEDAEVEGRADGGQPDNRHDDQRRGQLQRDRKAHGSFSFGSKWSASASPSALMPPAGSPAVFGGG